MPSAGGLFRRVGVQRIPALLAVLWAVPIVVWSVSGAPIGTVGFAIPILATAVLLWFRTLFTRIPGLILAGMVTFVFLFGSAEEGVFSSSSDHMAPIALQFLFGLAWGGLVCLVSLASLFFLGPRRARLGWPAGLSFLLAGYWLCIFLADTFFSANLPGLRWLFAPILVVVFFVAGFLLWRPSPLYRLVLALACFTLLATGLFWIAYAPLLSLGGTFPPAMPGEYATALPWPPLLILSLLANLVLIALLARSGLSSGNGTPVQSSATGSGRIGAGRSPQSQ